MLATQSPGRLAFDARVEIWPLAEAFVISRGAKTEARVVVVEVTDGIATGRGECVPYARYNETTNGVLVAAEAAAARLVASIPADGAGLTPAAARAWLSCEVPAGAVRNVLDCALWDLEARQQGKSVRALAGLPAFAPVVTVYTLSLDTPDAMATKARSMAALPLLKLKLGAPDDPAGHGDSARMRAVRAARPDARLIADANEGWTADTLPGLLSVAAECGFELVEQPLPVDADGILAEGHRAVPVCADESLHTRADLTKLRARYDAVNVKLDKTGGLTEALTLVTDARALGFEVMVGSMVSTSLAVAPALLLTHAARWVDLDGPLLLAQDRPDGLTIENGVIVAPGAWGLGRALPPTA